MLIQFSIKNYKTFKDNNTLSLVASNYDKETKEESNITVVDKFGYRLAKSAVIYGANASGKSKLIDALSFMRYFVLNSSKEGQKGQRIDVDPFRLSVDTENMPSEFEVIFLHDNEQFRYGFEVDKNRVISEWLYHKPHTKEVELFYRDEDKFEIHNRNFTKGALVVREELVRDNALLISVAAQFNEDKAMKVLDWFKRLKVLSGLSELAYHGYTMQKTKDPEIKQRILELLKAADLSISDIQLELLDIENLPKAMPKSLQEKIVKESKEENAEFISDVLTMHKKYDSNMQSVDTIGFCMDEDESSGTQKFFALTGPILDVLENGYTLIVDELDSKLHPNLVCKIVSMFNSKEYNKKNAQLIFNTHDTNLLGANLFRRDQIWFTNKNRYGEAKLYSLDDFKSDVVRKNENYEENYIKGKYGGIPYLEAFDMLIDNFLQHENEEQKE